METEWCRDEGIVGALSPLQTLDGDSSVGTDGLHLVEPVLDLGLEGGDASKQGLLSDLGQRWWRMRHGGRIGPGWAAWRVRGWGPGKAHERV